MKRSGRHAWYAVILAATVSCSPGAAQVDAAVTDPYDAGDDATIRSACPAAAPALEDCFRGHTFADCGGTEAAVVGCGVEGCFWFVGGCVADGYVGCAPAPCVWKDNDACAPELLFRWGWEPWDRDRAMAVAVSQDPALTVAVTAVTCEGCGAGCAGEHPCDDSWEERVLRATLPGTLVVEIRAGDSEPIWKLSIEGDLGESTARICRVGDVIGKYGCGGPNYQPPCATSGTLVLSRFPESEADVAGLVGQFQSVFDDGWTIQGTFLIE